MKILGWEMTFEGYWSHLNTFYLGFVSKTESNAEFYICVFNFSVCFYNKEKDDSFWGRYYSKTIAERVD